MLLLTRALSGNYVNFGVFALYGDRALSDCLQVRGAHERCDRPAPLPACFPRATLGSGWCAPPSSPTASHGWCTPPNTPSSHTPTPPLFPSPSPHAGDDQPVPVHLARRHHGVHEGLARLLHAARAARAQRNRPPPSSASRSRWCDPPRLLSVLCSLSPRLQVRNHAAMIVELGTPVLKHICLSLQVVMPLPPSLTAHTSSFQPASSPHPSPLTPPPTSTSHLAGGAQELRGRDLVAVRRRARAPRALGGVSPHPACSQWCAPLASPRVQVRRRARAPRRLVRRATPPRGSTQPRTEQTPTPHQNHTRPSLPPAHASRGSHAGRGGSHFRTLTEEREAPAKAQLAAHLAAEPQLFSAQLEVSSHTTDRRTTSHPPPPPPSRTSRGAPRELSMTH